MVFALSFILLGLEIGYARIRKWAEQQYPTIRREFIVDKFGKSVGLTLAATLAISIFVLCLLTTGVVS